MMDCDGDNDQSTDGRAIVVAALRGLAVIRAPRTTDKARAAGIVLPSKWIDEDDD